MGSIKFLISVTLITLFTIAVITFATQFGDDNNAAVVLSGEGNWTNINTTLRDETENIYTDINSSSDTFFTTTQEQGDQSSSSGGQFKGGIRATLGMATGAISGGFQAIFGDDREGFGIFFTALSSILLFMLIAYGWKYWRGNPD